MNSGERPRLRADSPDSVAEPCSETFENRFGPRWFPIGMIGLLACVPGALFVLLGNTGKGGGAGDVIVLLFLGVVTFVLGLPWNIVLTAVWSFLASTLDNPRWMGPVGDEWGSMGIPLLLSIPGAFVNGALMAWIKFRSRRRR